MDIVIQLLKNEPQPVRGVSWRAEQLIYPRVAPGAAVRLDHGGRPVGQIVETWWSGDALLARARIDDSHETDVREQLDGYGYGASLEFSGGLGLDRELIADVMPDGGSVMRIRGTRIEGVAIGLTNPARGDTKVVHVPAAPREPVLATRAAARFPLPDPDVMRYAGGGHVISVR